MNVHRRRKTRGRGPGIHIYFDSIERSDMHFPELSEMGHHYAAEEGTEGVRRMVLNSYAASLTQLQMDLGAAKLRAALQTATTTTGSIQARIAFFQNGTGTAQREMA